MGCIGRIRERGLIKSKANLALSILFLANAILYFAGRNGVAGQPYRQYSWVLWLLIAAIWLYRSFKEEPKLPQRDPLRTLPAGNLYLISAVLFVGITLAYPLWREFKEPSQPFWNGFLALFLAALTIGTFFGVRYAQKNRIEFGEARRSPGDANVP